jgi:hypothetical protein
MKKTDRNFFFIMALVLGTALLILACCAIQPGCRRPGQ